MESLTTFFSTTAAPSRKSGRNVLLLSVEGERCLSNSVECDSLLKDFEEALIGGKNSGLSGTRKGEVEVGRFCDSAEEFTPRVEVTTHRVVLRPAFSENLDGCVEDFFSFLDDRRIRQGSFVTVGNAASLLWRTALHDHKRVRNALVINGSASPKARPFEKMVQKLEERLPLGLPFRGMSGAFYALPFLERFRFPSVVLTLPGSTVSEKREVERLTRELPIAWNPILRHNGETLSELVEIFYTLLQIPAKCPQKNRTPSPNPVREGAVIS